MNELLVRTKDGNVAGRIEERVFIKEVWGNRHMLKVPAAWSIDADIFDRVLVPNCYSICIRDRDTGYKYTASVKAFKEKCGTLNRGRGRQYYLELIHWRVTE